MGVVHERDLSDDFILRTRPPAEALRHESLSITSFVVDRRGPRSNEQAPGRSVKHGADWQTAARVYHGHGAMRDRESLAQATDCTQQRHRRPTEV